MKREEGKERVTGNWQGGAPCPSHAAAAPVARRRRRRRRRRTRGLLERGRIDAWGGALPGAQPWEPQSKPLARGRGRRHQPRRLHQEPHRHPQEEVRDREVRHRHLLRAPTSTASTSSSVPTTRPPTPP
ncbi:unnamed protein product [Musa hybrid cultivar]